MAGGIKLSSPGKKSMSEDMFLDVPTMLAPSGKDAEQVHRSSVLDYASAARDVHSRVYGACTAEAAASESSGLSVGGCIARFGPWAVTPRRGGPGRIRGLTTSASEQTTSHIELRSLNFNARSCLFGRTF